MTLAWSIGQAARGYFAGTASVADFHLLVKADLLGGDAPADALKYYELMQDVLDEDGDLADPVERRANRWRVTHYRPLVKEYYVMPLVLGRQRPRERRTRRTRRVRVRSGSRGDPPDGDDADLEPPLVRGRAGRGRLGVGAA